MKSCLSIPCLYSPDKLRLPLTQIKIVTIKFNRDEDKETVTPSFVFPTQYMMQLLFTTQSTQFNIHLFLLEKNVDILNFQPSRQPIYALTSSSRHCYWDPYCPCKACLKSRWSLYDEDDDRLKRKKLSQKTFQQRYENRP